MTTTALLLIPFGLLIGISLGAVGGGGSILAVPVFVFVAGQSAKEATVSSLFVVGTSALSGLRPHVKAGRTKVGPGLAFGGAGIGGSYVGARINAKVNPDTLLLVFALLVLVAARAMWRRNRAAGDGPSGAPVVTAAPGVPRVGAGLFSGPSLAMAAKVLLAGTVVGFLTGFFGVGGGFVIVPALVLSLGFTMPQAAGTSLLVIAINSAVALFLKRLVGRVRLGAHPAVYGHGATWCAGGSPSVWATGSAQAHQRVCRPVGSCCHLHGRSCRLQPVTSLGARREKLVGWLFVGVQIVLIGLLIVLPGGDAWSRPQWVRAVTQVLFFAGLGIVLAGSVGLGRLLTATPEPKAHGQLRTGGLQSVVRHPIYSGVMLLVAGMVLRSGNLLALFVGCVLVVFFNVKARWEEARLRRAYADYDEYARSVPRFIPRVVR